jgi:hypothetical protein
MRTLVLFLFYTCLAPSLRDSSPYPRRSRGQLGPNYHYRLSVGTTLPTVEEILQSVALDHHPHRGVHCAFDSKNLEPNLNNL